MPKFVPRQRKHKVVARQKAARNDDAPQADANADQILPAEQRERDERRRALKDDLVRDAQGKMSGKKKKRLDKYIDTKLKKEENLELLKKLASQSHKVDTSLFQSSKKLGSGADTKREALRRALAERRAGVDVEKNEGLLFEEHSFCGQRDSDRTCGQAKTAKELHTDPTQTQSSTVKLARTRGYPFYTL
jgi:ATP-dependent RNA helicase DHX37/DHR1